MFVYVYVCVCVCMCVYESACVCMYVFVCVLCVHGLYSLTMLLPVGWDTIPLSSIRRSCVRTRMSVECWTSFRSERFGKSGYPWCMLVCVGAEKKDYRTFAIRALS